MDDKAQRDLMDFELPAEVWLAAEEVALEKLLDLQPGGTLKLKRNPDGPVDLVVNGAVVASGELVVLDGKFGFRVAESSERELANLHGRAGSEPEEKEEKEKEEEVVDS